jgi:hypothetical protein
MKDPDAKVDEKDIYWKEKRTESGKKYEVGYLKSNIVFENDEASRLGDKKDFGIGVNWPIGEANWNYTDSNIRSRAAITRYCLYNQQGETYQYRLIFTNTEHYDYYFYDETGDRYEVDTFRNGDHFVRYNSENPDIVYIKGS